MRRLSPALARAMSMRRRMDPMTILFGPWAPDLPPLANPGLTLAQNVIPASASYRPLPGLSVQSNALDARCRGAAAARDTTGNVYFYAGDAAKLYEIRNQTVTDKSKSGGYTTSGDNNWIFRQFGQTIIGTNYDDPVQSIAVGSGSAFADHFTSTNKPKARCMGVIRNFLMLGDTNDTSDGIKPQRVWWSAIGDSTDMDPDAATQSDYTDLDDGGRVQHILDGVEFGLIFQQRRIVRASYIGPKVIFDLYPIDRQRGTPVPGSVIGWGRLAAFWSEEGVFLNDGSQSYPIGHDQVDRWIWDQFDPLNAPRVSAAIDPINKVFAWAFPGTGNTAGAPNRLVFYNWRDKKWGYGVVDTEIVVSAETQAYTLEQLDSVSSDLETLTPTLDSPVWQGGRLRFGAFDTAHKLNYFLGDNLAAVLETGDRQMFKGRRGTVRKARPLVEGAAATCAVAGRDDLSASQTFGSDTAEDTFGTAALRKRARYHRFRTSVAAAADWDHAIGVEVEAYPGGYR